VARAGRVEAVAAGATASEPAARVEWMRLLCDQVRSFHAAASDAAISRLHGGIHHPMAIEDGLGKAAASGAGSMASARDAR
jgi:hypothetical protein